MSLHFVDEVFSFMLYYNWDNMCVRSAGCELKDDRDAPVAIITVFDVASLGKWQLQLTVELNY